MGAVSDCRALPVCRRPFGSVGIPFEHNAIRREMP